MPCICKYCHNSYIFHLTSTAGLLLPHRLAAIYENVKSTDETTIFCNNFVLLCKILFQAQREKIAFNISKIFCQILYHFSSFSLVVRFTAFAFIQRYCIIISLCFLLPFFSCPTCARAFNDEGKEKNFKRFKSLFAPHFRKQTATSSTFVKHKKRARKAAISTEQKLLPRIMRLKQRFFFSFRSVIQ